MSLITSIFGGMLLAAVVYFVARRLGRSNFWSAILAAGIPSLGYFAYAAAARPSLDVLTLNLIAYPTVAVILFQLYGGRNQGKVHWVPKLLVGLFVLLIVLLGCFVYISTNGLPPALAKVFLPKTAASRPLHTGFSGTVEHGESAAKGINQHLKMQADMSALGWQVEVEGLGQLNEQAERAVTLHLRKTDGQAVEQARIQLGLKKPGQRVVQTTLLAPANPGHYAAAVRLPAAGHWLAQIDIEHSGKHIRLEHALGGE
jgi:nitrogen fixation protein FixH